MKEERPAVPDAVDEILASWRGEFPEATNPPCELAKRVGRLSVHLNAATDAALGPLGLQKAEFGVLMTLRRIGPPYRLRPNELTRQLLLSSGGTSNALRRMAENGLVVRAADPNDQRSSWVRLTPKGVRVAEEAVRAWAAAQATLFAKVPTRTLRDVGDLLREVLVALGDGRPRRKSASRA